MVGKGVKINDVILHNIFACSHSFISASGSFSQCAIALLLRGNGDSVAMNVFSLL